MIRACALAGLWLALAGVAAAQEPPPAPQRPPPPAAAPPPLPGPPPERVPGGGTSDSFDPSEEISEDSPVAFPVDI